MGCNGQVFSTLDPGAALFPTFRRSLAVALPFAHCDQTATGLAPPRVCPCWAHTKKPRLSAWFFGYFLNLESLFFRLWLWLIENKGDARSDAVFDNFAFFNDHFLL